MANSAKGNAKVDRGSNRPGRQAKISEAMVLFQSALNREPTNVSLLIRVAVECDYLMRYEEALQLLKAVLELEPDHPERITLKVFMMKYHYTLNQ